MKKVLTKLAGIALVTLGIASILYINNIPEEMKGSYVVISVILVVTGIAFLFNK